MYRSSNIPELTLQTYRKTCTSHATNFPWWKYWSISISQAKRKLSNRLERYWAKNRQSICINLVSLRNQMKNLQTKITAFTRIQLNKIFGEAMSSSAMQIYVTIRTLALHILPTGFFGPQVKWFSCILHLGLNLLHSTSLEIKRHEILLVTFLHIYKFLSVTG